MEDFEQNEHIGWDTMDRPTYERGRLWHIGMPLAALGLLIYAVLSANFLFAFIVILFSLITYLSSISAPERIRFAVTDEGVIVGRKRWPFRDITRFWFVYDPPHIKNLYLETTSYVQPRISVDLSDTDPNEVRTVLGKFVKEELVETDEPLSDVISRLLKI
jgi:hypothetical protein